MFVFMFNLLRKKTEWPLSSVSPNSTTCSMFSLSPMIASPMAGRYGMEMLPHAPPTQRDSLHVITLSLFLSLSLSDFDVRHALARLPWQHISQYPLPLPSLSLCSGRFTMVQPASCSTMVARWWAEGGERVIQHQQTSVQSTSAFFFLSSSSVFRGSVPHTPLTASPHLRHLYERLYWAISYGHNTVSSRDVLKKECHRTGIVIIWHGMVRPGGFVDAGGWSDECWFYGKVREVH